jgi:4-amino-4-deoxy-L-arabinose transferase-like glycosyltransferase
MARSDASSTPDAPVKPNPQPPTATRPRQFRSADESRPIWTLPACLALQLILFSAFAYFRLIDSDEGLYLLAVKLVAQGKRPYLDFFFQQMPGLPYVYALWSGAVGLSFTSARMLSVLFSLALGGLLYWHIERLYSRKTLACLAVLLYAFNNLVLAWHSVVKTYALSNLLLFCAYLLVFPETKRESFWKPFLGGLLLALAVDTRLYLIGVAPVLMASLYYSGSRTGGRLKHVWPFVGGLALGLLPNLLFLSRVGFNTYVFDNLGYHLIRGDTGFAAGMRQRLRTFFAITNIQGSFDGSGQQFVLLSLPALATLVFHEVDRRLFFPLAMALALFVICLVPSPPFPQYFCVCVPYMVIVAVGFLATVARSLEVGDAARGLLRAFGWLIAGIYVLCGVLTFYNYALTGIGVEGIMEKYNRFDYQLSTVRQVSREVRHLAAKDEPVISFWPGYVVECDCAPQEGMENDFGLGVSPRLSAAEADRYKIITDQGVRDLIKRHYPRVVVVNGVGVVMPALGEGWGIPYRDMLRRNGYQLVRSIGRAEIYLWTNPQ